mgnify:CR=1 FL=1
MSVSEVVGRTKAFKEEMRHYEGVRSQISSSQEENQENLQRRIQIRAKKYPSVGREIDLYIF